MVPALTDRYTVFEGYQEDPGTVPLISAKKKLQHTRTPGR